MNVYPRVRWKNSKKMDRAGNGVKNPSRRSGLDWGVSVVSGELKTWRSCSQQKFTACPCWSLDKGRWEVGVQLSSDIQSRWQGHRILTGMKFTVVQLLPIGQNLNAENSEPNHQHLQRSSG